MVPDASGLAHAAGGNDDLGGRVGVQCHGFLRGAGKLQPGETDGLKAVFQQLVHDSHDTTGTVHILDVVGVRVGSNLAEARSLAGEHIDIVHREVRLSFLRDGEQVENRIGGTTHCNIQ